MSTTVSFITSVVVNYWLSMKYVFDHREGMSRKRRVHDLHHSVGDWFGP